MIFKKHHNVTLTNLIMEVLRNNEFLLYKIKMYDLH